MHLFKHKYYRLAPYNIFPAAPSQTNSTLQNDSKTIWQALLDYGVDCICVRATQSASTIQYHFDLTNLKHHVRVLRCDKMLSAILYRQVIVGASKTAHFCVTVPRSDRQPVNFIDTLQPRNDSTPLNVAIGEATDGTTLSTNIASLPHLLIAGATGSGKSVLMHSIICNLLFNAAPNKAKLLLIDTKQIELALYDGIPHLFSPIITDDRTALSALADMCITMDRRYTAIKHGKFPGPPIIIIIDELADLMLRSKKAAENYIVRIAQLGRAASIHLILATQRPTVNVVTGLIKANIPARIALTMASYRDAGVIEVPGADKLSGRGDALYQPYDHTQRPIRFQATFTDNKTINALKAHWTSKNCIVKR